MRSTRITIKISLFCTDVYMHSRRTPRSCAAGLHSNDEMREINKGRMQVEWTERSERAKRKLLKLSVNFCTGHRTQNSAIIVFSRRDDYNLDPWNCHAACPTCHKRQFNLCRKHNHNHSRCPLNGHCLYNLTTITFYGHCADNLGRSNIHVELICWSWFRLT